MPYNVQDKNMIRVKFKCLMVPLILSRTMTCLFGILRVIRHIKALTREKLNFDLTVGELVKIMRILTYIKVKYHL